MGSEPLVLVVERDAALRDVLVQVLAELGYRSRLLADIHQIATAAKEELVAAVVAGAWGPSRTRLLDFERAEIRHLARFAPVILLSGAAWTHTVTADEVGVRCILEHPLDIDLLQAELQRCVHELHKGDLPLRVMASGELRAEPHAHARNLAAGGRPGCLVPRQCHQVLGSGSNQRATRVEFRFRSRESRRRGLHPHTKPHIRLNRGTDVGATSGRPAAGGRR